MYNADIPINVYRIHASVRGVWFLCGSFGRVTTFAPGQLNTNLSLTVSKTLMVTHSGWPVFPVTSQICRV